jgi:hypothetical protein
MSERAADPVTDAPGDGCPLTTLRADNSKRRIHLWMRWREPILCRRLVVDLAIYERPTSDIAKAISRLNP